MPNGLIDLIVSDHREFERCFQELESGGMTQEDRTSLVEHLIAGLVRHSIAEEMYLYPAARTALSDGDRVADHEIEEHAEVEKLMKELERLGPGDDGFEPLLTRVIGEVRHHVAEEEDNLLPRMREMCTREQLADLGRKFADAKTVAPTRPHPLAPNRPPGNKLLAPGTGIVDQVRDVLSGRRT